MPKQFQNVWYSTDERVQIITRWIVFSFVYEDRGVLQVSPEKLKFHGKNHTLDMANIKNMSLFHLKPPKVLQNMLTILLLIMVLSALFVIYVNYTIVSHYSVSPILMIVSFLLLVPVMFITFVHFSSVGPLGSSRWVKVDYIDEQNQPQIVYFADGSWLGWGGILGGTQEMYKGIRKAVNEFSN